MRVLLGALLLLGSCCGSASVEHSLRYFYTSIWEPEGGPPLFLGVGYVDDQPGGHYDSRGRRALPRAPWMRRVELDDPHFWLWNTRKALNHQLRFQEDLQQLWRQNNRTGGTYTLQRMYGCALKEDGRKVGFEQYGFNGRDFISFDKDTLTWTAVTAAAQVTKRQLDGQLERSQSLKAYLEEECLHWLQKFLEYGAAVLLRKEAPAMKVTQTATENGLETLLCRAHGFYPKEIDATWRKDGEVWEEGTFRGVVSPNADGTYYTWLGITIDPKDRARYRCHVEHEGLLEPLDLAVEEKSGTRVGLIAGAILGAVVAVLLLTTGIILYIKRRLQGGYGKACASDTGSESSVRESIAE